MLLVQNNIIALLNDEVNTVLLQRVLWVSADGKEIVVVDISDNENLKFPVFQSSDEIVNEIQEGKARIVQAEPDLRLISPEEDYLNKYKENRDANWNIIKEIVNQEPDIYISEMRGKLVKDTIEKTGKSKKEIYRLLKRYWFYGKTKNGLLKNYFDCGAPGVPRNYENKPGPKPRDGNNFIVKEEDKLIFEKAIKEFHKERKMTLTATHQHMCEKYYNTGYYRKYGVLVPIVEPEKSPTVRQFFYWYYNEYKFAERYANRNGQRKATMNIRPLQGDAQERALCVGYLFEIDSTPADIILVSEDRKTNLGTPTLYIVMDVFSRLIVGFHASLAHASTIEQMVALENTGTNKVEFCKQYDLEIEESDWPCAHLPQFLAGDRGELKSKWSENLVNIKVDVGNAPSYRGDLKPHIEQQFRLTNDKIRELFSKEGAKPGKPTERGEFDPARNAALTIYEFIRFMIIRIISYNKSALSKGYFVTKEMFEEKVKLSPLSVWNWGEGKSLLHEEPRSLLRYNLLPKEKATVTRSGIEFAGMCYTSEIGLRDGWFEEKRIDGKKEIQISYDPRNVSSIFLRLKSGELVQCYLTQKYKEYEGLYLEEVKAILKYKKEQINEMEKEEKQPQAELHAFSNKLAKEASKQTRDATSGISFYQRQKDKRETKKLESMSIGSENAWTVSNPTVSDNDLNQTGEIISFPVNSSTETSNGSNEIKKQFGAKNKERRWNRESLE